MKFRIIQILIIFSVIIFSFQVNEISAEKHCKDIGMIEEDDGHCIARCGEGTDWDATNKICTITTKNQIYEAFSDIDTLIGIGIVAGIVISFFAIRNAARERREQKKKEDLEIIQNYGNQLSEINNVEKELSTKLDCALYAEQYLDTLEQIATLHKKGLLRSGVTDYFKNHFRYGINLWDWYKTNVEKSPDYEFKSIQDQNLEDIKESDRWKYFGQWIVNEKLKRFNSQNMEDILTDRIRQLKDKIEEPNEAEKQKLVKEKDILTDRIRQLKDKIEKPNEAEKQKLVKEKDILEKLLHKFNDNNELKEGDIRDILDKNGTFTNSEVLKYVRTYTKDAENKVLPDLMEIEYEEIPDENGLTKFEILETIQKYSDRISEIKNQERRLHSKLDCIVYAEQYLDTMDQIASLIRKKVFPKDTKDYFENNFGYGINLMNWYYKNVIDDYDIGKFDSEEPIKQKKLAEESDIEDRWIDFRWICRGGDNREGPITCFTKEDASMSDALKKAIGAEITLPMTMYQYEELPEEEGINPEEILEIMREYSTALIELTEKETGLKTQVDCAVYAEQYLDTLDQIGYLLNTKALATDSSTFFENNFAYGLTLKIWYDLKIFGAEGQEGRWDQFLEYCDTFQNDDYEYEVLTAFNLKDVLPATMLFVDDLPVDVTHERENIKYEKEEKDGTLHTPDIYIAWDEYYEKWWQWQDNIKVESKDDLKSRQFTQNAIKNFMKIWEESKKDLNEFRKIFVSKLKDQIKD